MFHFFITVTSSSVSATPMNIQSLCTVLIWGRKKLRQGPKDSWLRRTPSYWWGKRVTHKFKLTSCFLEQQFLAHGKTLLHGKHMVLGSDEGGPCLRQSGLLMPKQVRSGGHSGGEYAPCTLFMTKVSMEAVRSRMELVPGTKSQKQQHFYGYNHCLRLSQNLEQGF